MIYFTLKVEARGLLHLAQEGTKYDVVSPVGCGCVGMILRHTGGGTADGYPQLLSSYYHTHDHYQPHQQQPTADIQLHSYHVLIPRAETYAEI